MSDTCRGSLRPLRSTVLALLAVAAASPAVATAGWSAAPVTVGEVPGSLPAGVGHDVNGAGDSAIAWQRDGRVLVSSRPAGGAFTPPQDVGATFPQADAAPVVLVDERGVVTVVHRHRATAGAQTCNASEGGCDLRYARGEAGRAFGPSTLLRDATVAGVPRAALLTDGTVVVAATDTGGPLTGVTISTIGPDGVAAPAPILNDSVVVTQDATIAPPGVAAGPGGRALITWSTSVRATTAPAVGRVRGVLRSATGTISAAVDLATRTIQPVDAGDPATSRLLTLSSTDPAWTPVGGAAVAYTARTRTQTSPSMSSTAVELESVALPPPVATLEPSAPQQHDALSFQEDGTTPAAGSISAVRLLSGEGNRLSLHWTRSLTADDDTTVRTIRAALRYAAAAPFEAPLDVGTQTGPTGVSADLRAAAPATLASGELLIPSRLGSIVRVRRVLGGGGLGEEFDPVTAAPSTVFNAAGSVDADAEGSAQLVYLEFGIGSGAPVTTIRALPYDEGRPTLGDVVIPSVATVGQAVELTATAADRWTAATPRWTVGQDADVTGTVIRRTFTSPGVVPVRVYAQDGVGSLSDPVERTITVVPVATPPAPPGTAPAPAPAPGPTPTPIEGAAPRPARVVLGALPRAGTSLRKTRRRLAVRVQVYEPGRLVLRLRRGTRTVASTTVTFRAAARRTVTLKLGRTRVRPGTHTVRATFDPVRAGARTVVASRRARLRP